ncbi:hypothetical protein [Ruminiclostridium cellobioparum]|uniref:hypothetical protein n=1 Tax=Ruminiclostridium cellobioparum TaxID=29355 RepID=UPI0028AC9A83|nr:hypothetical protein [Ruminiclostridium cellobioparum]
MLCFCPDVKNEDELIEMLKQGRWDRDIFEYLIETMSGKEEKVLDYRPVELFEMQARLIDENELLCLQFWNKGESGVYENFRYSLNNKQKELFDLFVIRINEIYDLLKNLVSNS